MMKILGFWRKKQRISPPKITSDSPIIKRVTYKITDGFTDLKPDYSLKELGEEQSQALELSTLDFTITEKEIEDYEKNFKTLSGQY